MSTVSETAAEPTPGPWRTDATYAHQMVHGPDGSFVVDCAVFFRDSKINAANARLIAAAPETAAERDRLAALNAELLRTLQNILHARSAETIRTATKQARAAIAKAREGQDGAA